MNRQLALSTAAGLLQREMPRVPDAKLQARRRYDGTVLSDASAAEPLSRPFTLKFERLLAKP